MSVLDKLYNSLEQEKEKVRINEGKIKRLETAKESMAGIKQKLRTRKKSAVRLAEGDDTYGGWTGERKKKTQQYFAETVISEYTDYISAVDRRHDDICDEITRLENENYRRNGTIGYLRGCINNLLNELETATN